MQETLNFGAAEKAKIAVVLSKFEEAATTNYVE